MRPHGKYYCKKVHTKLFKISVYRFRKMINPPNFSLSKYFYEFEIIFAKLIFAMNVNKS